MRPSSNLKCNFSKRKLKTNPGGANLLLKKTMWQQNNLNLTKATYWSLLQKRTFLIPPPVSKPVLKTQIEHPLYLCLLVLKSESALRAGTGSVWSTTASLEAGMWLAYNRPQITICWMNQQEMLGKKKSKVRTLSRYIVAGWEKVQNALQLPAGVTGDHKGYSGFIPRFCPCWDLGLGISRTPFLKVLKTLATRRKLTPRATDHSSR